MCRQSATICLVKPPTRQHRSTGPLAERLATLVDPRCRRGKRHPFVAVLLIACCAVVTGARSFVAIDEWAADAPQDVLARLGARTAAALAVRIPPSGATIRRIIKDTCPGGLADLLGHDPAGTDTLALDGKSARGSRLGATPAAHLLAAMTGTGMTATQLRVPEKTNEITCFVALLDPFDLRGVTVTGDALHTQRDNALPERQREAEVQPDAVADDLRRVAIAPVRRHLPGLHAPPPPPATIYPTITMAGAAFAQPDNASKRSSPRSPPAGSSAGCPGGPSWPAGRGHIRTDLHLRAVDPGS